MCFFTTCVFLHGHKEFAIDSISLEEQIRFQFSGPCYARLTDLQISGARETQWAHMKRDSVVKTETGMSVIST